MSHITPLNPHQAAAVTAIITQIAYNPKALHVILDDPKHALEMAGLSDDDITEIQVYLSGLYKVLLEHEKSDAFWSS